MTDGSHKIFNSFTDTEFELSCSGNVIWVLVNYCQSERDADLRLWTAPGCVGGWGRWGGVGWERGTHLQNKYGRQHYITSYFVLKLILVCMINGQIE